MSVHQVDIDLRRGTLHGRMRDILTGLAMRVLRPVLALRVYGEENVPQCGPLLAVCNHLSNADPPLLLAAFPRTIFFMGKAELFRIPILGPTLLRFGGFPVERGMPDRKAIRRALAVLDQGIAVGIFPEGGRSRTGALVQGFPGVGLLALQSGAPILPVAIYGTEFFPVNGERPPRRPRGKPRGVTICFGQPFHMPDRVDGRRVTSEEATYVTMLRIAELLPPEHRGIYSSADSTPPR